MFKYSHYYLITGVESDDGWSIYFAIDMNTGMITSLKTVRDLADTKMRLKVEVRNFTDKEWASKHGYYRSYRFLLEQTKPNI